MDAGAPLTDVKKALIDTAAAGKDLKCYQFRSSTVIFVGFLPFKRYRCSQSVGRLGYRQLAVCAFHCLWSTSHKISTFLDYLCIISVEFPFDGVHWSVLWNMKALGSNNLLFWISDMPNAVVFWDTLFRYHKFVRSVDFIGWYEFAPTDVDAVLV